MIVTTNMTLVNGVYKVALFTEATSIETALMAAYGEPSIDQAGSIPYIDGASQSHTFVIAGGPKLALIRSGMPIYFSLDSNIDSNAKYKVTGWGIEMKNRISSVLDTLKANPLLHQPEIVNYEL